MGSGEIGHGRIEPLSVRGGEERWPSHPTPLPGESAFSWLIRLAAANALGPHSFSQVISPSQRLLQLDIDRWLPEAAADLLAARTGVPASRIRDITMDALEGRLFEGAHAKGGKLGWVLPIARGRGRQGALQVCPACLAEDERPHFRRIWRLGFVVACEIHAGKLLWDRCPKCHAPFLPLRASSKERKGVSVLPLTTCRVCMRDLRVDPSRYLRSRHPALDSQGLAFQVGLVRALDEDWTWLEGHGPIYTLLWFRGVHHLLKVLGLRKVARALWVSEQRPPFASRPVIWRLGQHFELLGVTDRAYLMSRAGGLLQAWPDRFISFFKSAGVGSAELLQEIGQHAPYWYAVVVGQHFEKRYASWRRAGLPKQKQYSYGALWDRKRSQRLAARERRIVFIREHPELWGNHRELVLAMKEAGLYGGNSDPWAIERNIGNLIKLSQHPDEWWRIAGPPIQDLS